MFLYVISSISILAAAFGIILKLMITIRSGKNTKIKKDESAISLTAIDILDPCPIQSTMFSHTNIDASELRQRNHVVLDSSNLPRPSQVVTNNQSGESRMSVACNVVHSSSIRWQRLNAGSPEKQDSRHNAKSNVCDHMQLKGEDQTMSENMKCAPKGVGLRGTKPLVTINRLDLLLRPQGSTPHSSTSSIPRKPPSPKGNALPELRFTTLRLQDLKIDIVIGGGGFGQVWRGSWNGTPVAVKILNAVCQSTVPSAIINDFEEEVHLLARLRHPNICMFLGACLDPPNRAIVTELVSRGTLWDLLRNPILFSSFDSRTAFPGQEATKSIQPFHWPTWATRKVFEGTTRGLIYLHLQDIIHRGFVTSFN